jgi:hypothetical protein
MSTGLPNPWERREHESDPAWQAFREYRDAGPDRSLGGVVRRSTDGRPGRSLALVKRWSARHEWRRRVEAYDRHLDAGRVAAAEEVSAERGRTGAELAARVRAVLAEILDRPDLDSADVLRAARALRELALAVPEPPPATSVGGSRSGMRPVVTEDGHVIVDGRRIHPPPTEAEEVRKAAGVLAVLEEAGVIVLPPESAEPGRRAFVGGNGHADDPWPDDGNGYHHDDAY